MSGNTLADECHCIEDGPTCHTCHTAVRVEPDTEWECGDMCHRCTADAYPALRAAFDAMVIVTKQGQPCYRSAGGVPMGMPKRIERIVRRALK